MADENQFTGGGFPTTQAFPPSILYVIAENGELHWYRNESSSQPGGSKAWLGPSTIGTGFQGFTRFFNAGGVAMYGIQPDGTLLWFGFAGSSDGAPNWLNDAQPKHVATGWDIYQTVFPGGEFVIYGIRPDGTLFWHRHLDGGSGGTDWAGDPIQIATGWGHFVKVFSAGEGVIYAIDANGTLFRAVHKGLTGTPEWETETVTEIATGWNFFSHVAAGADGVIYGFTGDGRVFYMRFAEPRPVPAAGQPSGGLGEILNPGPVFVPGLPPTLVWEGPIVEIKDDMPGFLSVFPQMNAPDSGVD